MVLCLDIGNTQMYGGLFKDHRILFHFRKVSDRMASSDEIGIFLRTVLRENGADPKQVSNVAISSVVPDLNYSLGHAVRHYFQCEPFFLRPGVECGIKILYKNPLEVGADRIANSIAAMVRYPGRNIIIVDFGTATTFDVLTGQGEYLGGAIAPGMMLAMQSLEKKTAVLPKVELISTIQACGQSTVESIQSGIYWSNVGMIKELVRNITSENFNGEKPLVLATGGFASLFKEHNLFDEILPDLVLEGVLKALELNEQTSML